MRSDAAGGEATDRPTAAERPSLIYRNPQLYELMMSVLYLGHYRERFARIAELIPPGQSVVELCCGPARLYRGWLREKGVRYTGLDRNPIFIDYLNRHRIDGRIWDVASQRPLPPADYLLMHASLYQFLPRPEPVLDRMLGAARVAVLIAEPIRNLATQYPRLGALFAAATNAGAGPEEHRFDEQSLDSLMDGYAERIERSMPLAGGREKLYVLTADRGG